MAVPKTNTGAPIPLVIEYFDPDYVQTSNNVPGVTKGYWFLSDRLMKLGYVCSAIAGIEGLPVAMQSIPLLDGTALPLTYLPSTGTIGLAILVARPTSSSDQFAYYSLLDAMVRAFFNRRNENPAPGTLRITRPDGSQRQIAVYCTSGLNTPEVGLDDATLFTLALSTLDPYWSDVNDTALHFPVTFGNNGITFASPGIQFPSPGILFNPTQEAGAFVLSNWGDAYCFPNWLITGPGTPTVTNTRSNRSWALNTAIPAGQQVQLTTAKGHQSCVNVTTGTNIWNQLVFGGPHDLFPLLPGDNLVTISVTGATAATTVDVGFTNRWLRA
jgi:hypothetical protein